MQKTDTIFVGGSGSSGVHLLAQLLNLHREIHCASEVSIFDRDIDPMDPVDKYANFMELDSYIALDQRMPYPIMLTGEGQSSQFGLSSWRWQQLWPASHRAQMISVYKDTKYKLRDLYGVLMNNETISHGKTCWADATPGNLFYFDRLLDTWPDSKFIITVRNPFDSIYSQIYKRGFTQHEAICRWTASLQTAWKWLSNDDLSSRTQVISYDDLLDPERRDWIIKHLWAFVEGSLDACSELGVDILRQNDSPFLSYQDRIIPGVRELVYISTMPQWNLFCDLFAVTKGVTVE